MLSLPRCKPILPPGYSPLTRGITSSLGQGARSSSRSRKRQSTLKRFSSPQSPSNRSTVDDLNNLDLKLSSSSPSSSPSDDTAATVAAMPVKREPSPSVLDTWRSAKAVCFDVDSTLCTDESIDEIAAFLGVGEQVAALTSQLSLFVFLLFFPSRSVSLSPQRVRALELRAFLSDKEHRRKKKKKKLQGDGRLDKV